MGGQRCSAWHFEGRSTKGSPAGKPQLWLAVEPFGALRFPPGEPLQGNEELAAKAVRTGEFLCLVIIGRGRGTAGAEKRCVGRIFDIEEGQAKERLKIG